jgi:tRNA pseudouridine38-40 synthase
LCERRRRDEAGVEAHGHLNAPAVSGSPPDRTLRLRLAYDGTGLVGWQRQAHGTSVQGLLEAALGRIAGAPVTVSGAGRTDAGVHATGQVASVRTSTALDPSALRRALNATLPEEVRVLEVSDADPSFHARFSAVSKTYEYRILNGPVAPPSAVRTCWRIPYALDLAAMQAEAASLVGEHDFAAFRSTGSDVPSSVRRIFESRVDERALTTAPAQPSPVPVPVLAEGRMLLYVVRGSGFLRHMVRTIAGTLVAVGSGRLPRGSVASLLAPGARREDAGATAPAHGLCLVAVEYDGPREVAAHR